MDSSPSLTAEQLEDLVRLLGADVVLPLSANERYGSDMTEDLFFPPDVVVAPHTVEQVSQLLRWCNEHRVPVVARGAGTGLSGGALAVRAGVCLSMERFNRIVSIDEANFQATVEPGVINYVFQQALAEKGLFYPPDPSSWGSSTLGGNLAHNAGGPKAVKYGVTNAYVLNLQVVLANGTVLWTGANTLKNSTGYNLTQLFVGSEGTLGVITQAVFRLLPLPTHKVLILAPFGSATQACASVAALFKAGFSPCALEFMERDAIEYTLPYVPDAPIRLEEGVEAHLLIEFDGNDLSALTEQALGAAELLTEHHGAGAVLFADSEKDRESLWKLRRKVGEAVKTHSVYKEEDTVVPRAHLPELLAGVKEIGGRYGFRSVCYGHAGDGNLHVNILKGDLSEERWTSGLDPAIREIFALCKQLGGTLSGEHGVGWVQKGYLEVVQAPEHIELQRQIKRLFDPNNILNPDKIFPSSPAL